MKQTIKLRMDYTPDSLRELFTLIQERELYFDDIEITLGGCIVMHGGLETDFDLYYVKLQGYDLDIGDEFILELGELAHIKGLPMIFSP